MDLLLTALRSQEGIVRTAAARAVLRRTNARSREQLIAHLDQYPDDVRQILAAPTAQRLLRPWIVQAMRSGDPQLCRQACQYATENLDHQVLSVIVEQARVADHPCAEQLARATRTITFDLADRVYSTAPVELGADPAFPRRAALNALNRAVDDFALHGRMELLEAFATLVTPNDPVLSRVLADATHAASSPLIDLLHSSQSRGVLHMLVDSLLVDHPRRELLNAVRSRSDRAFVELLLTKIADPVPLRIRETIACLPGFAWAEEKHEEEFLSLPGECQATGLKLAVETKLSKRRLADLVKATIQRGEVAGRVAACSVVGRIRSEVATQVLREALTDSHPTVVAAAAAQLRLRGVEGSTENLINMLDSHAGESAHVEAEDMTYDTYLDAFSALTVAERHALGVLVAESDPACAQALLADLQSQDRDRRLRALEVVGPMGLADALADSLIELLKDPDESVRSAAAGALSETTNDEAIAALSAALRDAGQASRDPAEQSKQATPLVDLADSLIQDMQQEFHP